MTATPTTLTPAQRKLLKSLQKIATQIASAKAGLDKLYEDRRSLIVQAYEAGLDTVQLAKLLGMSSESIRQNLRHLGGLRTPARKEPEPTP